MKNIRTRFAILFLVSFAAMAQRPWQQMTAPTVRDVAPNFRFPPPEYGAIHWAFWGGELTKERIVQECYSLYANGSHVVRCVPARGITSHKGSPEYFD